MTGRKHSQGSSSSPQEGRGRGDQRRARQLCRQAHETLIFVLGGECGDESLGELHVPEVIPWHDESTLRVNLLAPPGTQDDELVRFQALLAEAQPAIRAAVASAVTRRRAPQILLHLEKGGHE